MIQCPICKSLCFDDMDVCYGCMHRFGADPGAEGFMASGLPDFEPEEPEKDDGIAVQSVCTSSADASAPHLVDPMGNHRVELVVSIQPVVVCDGCGRESRGKACDCTPSENGVTAHEIALEAENILARSFEHGAPPTGAGG